MKAQKEIGDLIREKVDSSAKTLEGPVWERIKSTLIQNKRKRTFYDWSLNGLIILFSTIGIYAISMSIEPATKVNTTKNSTSLPNPDTNTIYENSTSTHMTLGKDSVKEKIPVQKEIVGNPLQIKNNETLLVKTKTQDPNIELVAERTEKVYYYYNSKDGQEVMSKDAKVIDSVVNANAIKKDSMR